MKKICRKAGIKEKKVFPHNLRHLFACSFYQMEKDIAKLADLLGHSNINTTRIYIVSSGVEHRKQIEKMNLLLWWYNIIVIMLYKSDIKLICTVKYNINKN